MDNSAPDKPEAQDSSDKKSGPLIIFIAAFVLVVIALWQFTVGKVE